MISRQPRGPRTVMAVPNKLTCLKIGASLPRHEIQHQHEEEEGGPKTARRGGTCFVVTVFAHINPVFPRRFSFSPVYHTRKEPNSFKNDGNIYMAFPPFFSKEDGKPIYVLLHLSSQPKSSW